MVFATLGGLVDLIFGLYLAAVTRDPVNLSVFSFMAFIVLIAGHTKRRFMRASAVPRKYFGQALVLLAGWGLLHFGFGVIWHASFLSLLGLVAMLVVTITGIGFVVDGRKSTM